MKRYCSVIFHHGAGVLIIHVVVYSVADVHAEDPAMSSYYHPPKDADMASMTEPLCLERGTGMLNS